MSILHISDLHLRAGRPFPPSLRAASDALRSTPADLAVFTGDAMDHPGDESAAIDGLGQLLGSIDVRLGAFGVFGNHDSARFRTLARSLPIRWLGEPDAWAVPDPAIPLALAGASDPEDLLGTLASRPSNAAGMFTVLLVHYPSELYSASDLGFPVVLAGHTHGGQARFAPTLVPHTSSDMPMDQASGVLRRRDTLCCIARGLGEAVVQFRFNCARQIPLYMLRRGPLPGRAGTSVEVVRAW